MGLLKRLIELEADVLYREPAAGSEPECGYEPGTLPVLISAPHSAVHVRPAGDKDEEEYTAALARLVGEQTGAHVLYLRRRSAADGNWHSDAPYKQYLGSIVRNQNIRFVLDIHGASNRHTFGIALGTLLGRSCPGQRPAIIAALEDCGFRIEGEHLGRLDADFMFTGRGKVGQVTVTRYASETLKVPAAQFELHQAVRVVERRPDATLSGPYQADPLQIEKTICALSAVVEAVAKA